MLNNLLVMGATVKRKNGYIGIEKGVGRSLSIMGVEVGRTTDSSKVKKDLFGVR